MRAFGTVTVTPRLPRRCVAARRAIGCHREAKQQTLLYEHIIAPDGCLHFAGEHASLHHAWIQGAIESWLRATGEIDALAV